MSCTPSLMYLKMICFISRSILSSIHSHSYLFDHLHIPSTCLIHYLHPSILLIFVITHTFAIILITLLVDYHLNKVETNNTFRGMISSIKIHQILIVSIPNSIENPRNPCFTRFFYTIYCRKYTILLVCRLLYMTFH